MLDTRTVVRILNEDGVADRVKVEDLLPVALEVRPAGHLIVPVELPDGPAMGRAIDRTFSRAYLGVAPEDMPLWERPGWYLSTTLARVTRQPVAYKRFLVRDSFARHVHRSPAYRALRAWASRLGLVLLDGQVRPTIDEIYVGKGRQLAADVFDIQMRRSRIRQGYVSNYRQQGGPFHVFPEESDPEFIAAVGGMLGYPACCIDRYSQLRQTGESVEAAIAGELAGDGSVDSMAFFARDFVPCSPTCHEAAAIGRAMTDALDGVDPRLGRLCQRAFGDNVDRARRLPDLIKERQQQIQKQWGDIWLEGFRQQDAEDSEER